MQFDSLNSWQNKCEAKTTKTIWNCGEVTHLAFSRRGRIEPVEELNARRLIRNARRCRRTWVVIAKIAARGNLDSESEESEDSSLREDGCSVSKLGDPTSLNGQAIRVDYAGRLLLDVARLERLNCV